MEINIRPGNEATKETAGYTCRAVGKGATRSLSPRRAAALPQMNSIHRADSTIRLRQKEKAFGGKREIVPRVRRAGRKIVLLR